MNMMRTIGCKVGLHTWEPVVGDASGAHHKCLYCHKTKRVDTGVNGQVAVPAGGQLKVPTPRRLVSWFSVGFLRSLGPVSSGRSRRR